MRQAGGQSARSARSPRTDRTSSIDARASSFVIKMCLTFLFGKYTVYFPNRQVALRRRRGYPDTLKKRPPVGDRPRCSLRRTTVGTPYHRRCVVPAYEKRALLLHRVAGKATSTMNRSGHHFLIRRENFINRISCERDAIGWENIDAVENPIFRKYPG